MERLLKARGFTLIELVIVIIILAVLAVVTYFKWSSTSLNLPSQAALLATDIRYTQNLSMTQHQRFRLAITSSTTYQIQNGSGVAVTIPTRGTTTTLASGITFGARTTITNKIIFNAEGIPYDDSPEVPITANAVIPLVSGSETINVTIYPETGRVTP